MRRLYISNLPWALAGTVIYQFFRFSIGSQVESILAVLLRILFVALVLTIVDRVVWGKK